MAAHIWIMRIYQSGGKWVVDWRYGPKGARKRTRKFFNAKSTAQTFASVTRSELRDYGDAWLRLATWERSAMVEAWERAKRGGYGLLDACEAFEKTKLGGTMIAVAELVRQCIAAKERKNLRPDSLRQLRRVQEAFVAVHGERPAVSITPQEIADFLNQPTWGPRRRLGVLKELRSLYNWGIRQDLLAKNPAKAVENPVLDDGPVIILSVEQAEKLMHLGLTKYPKLIPYLAICLFGGLRDAEAGRLKWTDVDFERNLIRLAPFQTKTRERRLVPLHDTCASWLAWEPRRTGHLLKHRSQLKYLRAESGCWSRNVLRHSYISYELARTEDENATALRAGTSPQMIHKHYRELVTPEDAQRFWKIFPH